jgi:hypothetical protein
MDRRQYLVATGTVLSTGFAGCLGGGSEDSRPTEPYIAESEISVETSPQIRVSVPVVNPTDGAVTRKIWIRLYDQNGNVLDEASKVSTLDPTAEGTTPPGIPFIFDEVAYSGTEIDTDATEAILTVSDAESPF